MVWPVDDLVELGGDIVEVASDVVDEAGDIASSVGDAAETLGGSLLDAVGAAVGVASDAAGDVMGVAGTLVDPVLDAVITPVGDTMLSALDDSGFFDVVDYATLDIVDLNYDENGFNADIGIDDVWGYSVQIGDGGFGVGVQYGGQTVGFSANDEGVGASAAMGFDYGPLPYAEAHGSMQADGDVGVGGEWQGYFPTPAGMVGGDVTGDYQETDDGFESSGQIQPGIFLPSGTYVEADVHGTYGEDAQGYHETIGVGADVGQVGGPEVGVSLDYNQSREGDVYSEGVTASAYVEDELTGTRIAGSLGYEHTESSQGETDTVFGAFDVKQGDFEVSGSGGYRHSEGADGSSADAVFGNADVSAGDYEVSGSAGYAHGENADGSSTDTVFGSGEVTGPDGFEAGGSGSVTVGPDGEVSAQGDAYDSDLPTDELPDAPPSASDLVPSPDDPGTY